MPRKTREIKLRDYGDDELNLLAQAGDAFAKMTEVQRARAFYWFKGKYSKEWPPESTYQ